MRMACLTSDSPRPPYSLGHEMPIQPRLPSFLRNSRVWGQFLVEKLLSPPPLLRSGAGVSLWMKSRTSARNASSSAVKRNSMPSLQRAPKTSFPLGGRLYLRKGNRALPCGRARTV